MEEVQTSRNDLVLDEEVSKFTPLKLRQIAAMKPL